MCCIIVGDVIRVLGEGGPICGVASLRNRFYVLRGNVSSHEIEVYNNDTYDLLRHIDVPELGYASDIAVSARHNCAYVADMPSHSVHRVMLSGNAATEWCVGDVPSCLSLTSNHNVLVTCQSVAMIKEFSTVGDLLREIDLQSDIVSPWHSVQLSSGDFLTCHGDPGEQLHRVCLVNASGSVVNSFGELPYSGTEVMNTPSHMAVWGNEYVFVIDRSNSRVVLLSPELVYVREVISRDGLGWRPFKLSLDGKRDRLYVAVNERNKRGQFAAGRIVVVDV